RCRWTTTGRDLRRERRTCGTQVRPLPTADSLSVEHHYVLDLLTIRHGHFLFRGERLAVLGNLAARGTYRLAALLQREFGPMAVNLLTRQAVVVAGSRDGEILAVKLIRRVRGYFLPIRRNGRHVERNPVARLRVRSCLTFDPRARLECGLGR